jgi:peptide/nickel transport system substrate-binding protein
MALGAAASAKPSRSPSASPATSPAPTASPTASADPNASPLAKIEVDFYDTEDALAAAFAAGQIDGASGLTAATTKTMGATDGARVLDYPTTTLSAILLNQRPSHPELTDPNVRKALLGAIDRATIASTDLGGQARVADALLPPESWAYDASRVAPVPYDRSASAKLLRAAGWTRSGGKWTAPKGKAPYAINLLTVPAAVNPRLAAVASAVKDDWTRLGLTVTVTPLSGSALATKLKAGDFSAAVLDIASGFEPDLYPLLDSSQVRANGSNRSGYQDPALDKLLEAARRNGTTARRKGAWSALLAGLSSKLPVLPIVWADEQMVVRGLSGNTLGLIVHTGDRFWDVLAWRLAATR